MYRIFVLLIQIDTSMPRRTSLLSIAKTLTLTLSPTIKELPFSSMEISILACNPNTHKHSLHAILNYDG